MMDSLNKYAFLVEWYDPQAQIIKQFNLIYHSKDNSCEMYDIKNHRQFLKKTKCENLRIEDFFIGSTINILSRQLKIVNFGDALTKNELGSSTQRTLAMIKPGAILKMGEIISIIESKGFVITNMGLFYLKPKEAMEFYAEHKGKHFLQDLVRSMTSGPMVALELMGTNAVQAWRDTIGPTDPSKAREQSPSLIRSKYGDDVTNNAVHGSDSEESAAREAEFFFPSDGSVPIRNTAVCGGDTTCAVVRPHSLVAGQLGAIICSIMNGGFRIQAMKLFRLDKVNVEEFLEVYKGVLVEYPDLVQEMSSGACVALEIAGSQRSPSSSSVHQLFREFCGPIDPELARHLRPNTIRALFGRDKIRNAIHCTDLPEDTSLELQYFFQILDE